MPLVHLVVVLALVEFSLFGWAVGRARARYGVAAPATSGHEAFERTFRAHANTLEQLVVFIPSILIFGQYLSALIAAALGVLFLIGRAVYFRGYVKSAATRHGGFLLGAVPLVALLAGALAGALRATLIVLWYPR
jgi:glutathione S-transferase